LLFDLCRGLANVEQVGPGDAGRRWRTWSSPAEGLHTVSSRRFACDLQAAHADGYLSRRMNSVSVCSYLENEGLTPVLKNLIVQSSVPLSLFETSFAPDSSGFRRRASCAGTMKNTVASVPATTGSGARHLRREDEHRHRGRDWRP
jgi:hypothetical protein